MMIDHNTWNSWAKMIADPFDPYEYAPSAVERLMTALEDHISRVKGIKTQFKAHNDILLIDFTTIEGKKYYNDAVERYKERVRKAQNNDKLTKAEINVIKLVAFLQYRIAAESNPDRITWLCDNMIKEVENGFAAVCACNFKTTIILCVKELVKRGINRNDISLIWGGGQTKPTKKQVAKATIESDELIQAAFAKHGIKIEDLGLEDIEAQLEVEELDPSLRLGTQTLKERQNEIDRFQKGRSLYCFFTFRAGGVGLSLHHTDEFTTQKVRHKESGYAYEEDIKTIPTRPRKTFVAPTWSPIEMVQGLGRVPRLTSLSDTIQYMVFFRLTVEERVAHIVGKGLKCLTKVTRQKEPWEGVMYGQEDKIIKEIEDIEIPDKDEDYGPLSESEEE